MARTPNIHGGGAQTNINGLGYERDTDLLHYISALEGINVDNNNIYRNGSLVAQHFSKYGLYSKFLKLREIDYRDYISSQLLPDDAFIVGNTCYIIEKKYQDTSGSADEKLQTFLFKKEQYQKLFFPIDIRVEIYYLLSEWFQRPKYRDTLLYIENNGSRYFFEPNELIASLNI
ncbi:hypothetical protein IOD06_09225 [Psychrobacter sp. N25K4-3-2]|uniref:hypothetical protein n=1 Tax=Psychrobacter sp. N25K4-3-2 TaxID=2785026 RepID=UPI00188A93BF|nr:hypothetical protein [Psychrobacter sp. N25K4-3-2]MBF4490070.1 hypothetical protein [Psychrobacter sp. N25K4-3-2]